MKMGMLVKWILATGLLVAGVVSLQQGDIDRLASTLVITAEVTTNLEHSGKSHQVKLTLTNNGSDVIPASGWRVYFHSFYMLFPDVLPRNKSIDLDEERVKFSVIGGDLYSFEPLSGFQEIETGQSRELMMTVAWWSISRTDFMPNWYMTSSNEAEAEPRVLTSTRTLDYVQPFNTPKQWKRYDFDEYNPYTVQERRKRYEVKDKHEWGGRDIPSDARTIPTPGHIEMHESGSSIIFGPGGSWKIYASSPQEEHLADLLSNLTGIKRVTTEQGIHNIKLSIKPGTLQAEGYTLRIDLSVIELIGNDASGLFYAVQSLVSLASKEDGNLVPMMTITDAPRYPYRGLFLDVARNFHTVADMKRVMEQMARYKLNSLHLHLADDEGWRLDIPGLPELTQVGGRRCHDLTEQSCIIPQYGSGPTDTTSGSGFYTTDDYKDILSFAQDHFIEVIPEFDMPGHAHAAIVSMEQRYRVKMAAGSTAEAEEFRLSDPNDQSEYLSVQQWNDNAVNPCIESTYAFIRKVVDEVKKMHATVMPLKTYHFGGDEVASGAWEKSPMCNQFLQENPKYNVSKGLKQYFAERVSTITADLGLGMRGWEDGLMDADNNPYPVEKMNNSRLSANPWDNIWEWGQSQRAYKLANAGYKVVMSQATHLYFDHPQEPDPEERGLYWATRFTDAYKTFGFLPDSLYDNIVEERSGKPLTKADVCGADMSKCDRLEKSENIIGIQGHLWSENIRTSEHMDFMLFPRVLALAERAWHKADFEHASLEPAARRELLDAEWTSFANTLGSKELWRLGRAGVQYRVPPPGASTVDGVVTGSVTYPGASVQYAYTPKDASPTLDWQTMYSRVNWDPKSDLFLRTEARPWLAPHFSRPVQVTYVEEPLPAVGQPMVDYIGSHVAARIEVLDNLNKTDNFMTVRLNLTNQGDTEITPGNWRIHLYSLYGFKTENLPCGLRVGHVNGGLFYLTPSSVSFSGLDPGKTLHCVLRNHWWSVTRTDQMPNWYVSAVGTKAKVIANTADETLSFVGKFDTPAKWKRTKEDRYNPYTASERYAMYKMDKSEHDPWKVVPTPDSVQNLDGSKQIKLTSDWTVEALSDFPFESKFLAEKLKLQLVRPGTSPKSIKFIKENQNNESEAYTLEIDPPNSVMIKAEDGRGALHGVQTLISLVEGSLNSSVPKITIVDKPRFEYRGIMLDVARNFKDKAQILKVLDAMSTYKLNKLHLHLSDDEGWRVEIPGLPELTEVGGRRCYTEEINACVLPAFGSGPDSDTSGSGYYTISDYRAILKYATDRHITIIPEIEMPGHANAAITSMAFRDEKIARLQANKMSNMHVPQSFTLTDVDKRTAVYSGQNWKVNAINPCMNSTYNFAEQVLNGFISLHTGIKPLKIFHVGGDEVPEGSWDTSEHCRNRTHENGAIPTYLLKQEFMARVADMVASRNMSMAAWEDGMYAHGRPNPATDYKTPVYAYTWSSQWDTDHATRASQFADAGYKVVLALATYLYLDHPYEPDPEERGLHWATRFMDTKKMFSFIPDHIWWNADVDRMGQPVDFDKICHNKPCPNPKKPENIIGMQASLFSETVRNEDHLHEMLFPRILALAERAWHKASWEDIEHKDGRDASRKADWEDFATSLGNKELARLDNSLIKYRVPPPGGMLTDDKLRVNTLYPNHDVEYSLDDGQTWTQIQAAEIVVSSAAEAVLIRSRSATMDRVSRVVEVKPSKRTEHVTVSSTTAKESATMISKTDTTPSTASSTTKSTKSATGSSTTNKATFAFVMFNTIVFKFSIL